MRNHQALWAVLLALTAFSCSRCCSGCTDTQSFTTFVDGGACFARSEMCGFPGPPHFARVTVSEIPCDGGF